MDRQTRHPACCSAVSLSVHLCSSKWPRHGAVHPACFSLDYAGPPLQLADVNVRCAPLQALNLMEKGKIYVKGLLEK